MHKGWGQHFNGDIKHCSGLSCRAVTAVQWKWNTGKGRGGLGLRANSAFGNSIFMDCGRMCFVPAAVEPGPGICDGKWENIENTEKSYRELAFLFSSEQSESYERISVLPQVTSQICLTIKFGVRRGRVPVERCFPSCAGLSLCPLFFIFRPVRKGFFFFFSQLVCKCFPDCLFM